MENQSNSVADVQQMPQVTQPQQVQQKKSLKIPLIIGFSVFFVLLLAGIGVAAFFAISNISKKSETISSNPDQRVSDAFSKIAVSSSESVSKASTETSLFSSPQSLLGLNSNPNDKGGSNEMGLAVKTVGDGFGGFDVNFNSTYKTKYDQKSQKASLNANFDLSVKSGSVKLEFSDIQADVITTEDKVYIKAKNLPEELYKSLDQSNPSLKIKQKVEDTWYFFDFKNFYKNQLGVDIDKELNKSENKESVKEITAFYERMVNESKNYKFFKNTKDLGSETVNGIQVVHYQTELNYDEITKFLKYSADEFVKLDKKMNEKNGTKSSIQSSGYDKEIDKAIEQFKSYVKFNNIDLYLGKNDNYIYKYNVDLDIKDASKLFTNKAGGDINIKFSFETIEKDKEQKIDVPSGSKDLVKFIEEVTGSKINAKPTSSTMKI